MNVVAVKLTWYKLAMENYCDLNELCKSIVI